MAVLNRLPSKINPRLLLLGTLVNALLVGLGAFLHHLKPLEQPIISLGFVAIFVLFCVIDEGLKLRHHQKELDASMAAIKQGIEEESATLNNQMIDALLHVASVSMLKAAGDPPMESIRVNIMLLDESGQHLTIKYLHGFSDSDMDRSIKIPINTGCAGQAWLHREPLVGDLSDLLESKVRWGLPQPEIEKIRKSLKSIFSMPIIKDDQCIGILNFDSDNTIEEMKFNDSKVQLIGFSFASAFAILLDHQL